MDQRKIGSFLKKLRNEKGLTQEQAGEQFNVSRRTVTRWETGANMPDLDVLVEIADFYDVDLRELFDGDLFLFYLFDGGFARCRLLLFLCHIIKILF